MQDLPLALSMGFKSEITEENVENKQSKNTISNIKQSSRESCVTQKVHISLTQESAISSYI